MDRICDGTTGGGVHLRRPARWSCELLIRAFEPPGRPDAWNLPLSCVQTLCTLLERICPGVIPSEWNRVVETEEEMKTNIGAFSAGCEKLGVPPALSLKWNALSERQVGGWG